MLIPLLKATQVQQQIIEKLQKENQEIKKMNEKYTSEIETLRNKIEDIKKYLVRVGAFGSNK